MKFTATRCIGDCLPPVEEEEEEDDIDEPEV
jgi:hypothetical protein